MIFHDMSIFVHILLSFPRVISAFPTHQRPPPTRGRALKGGFEAQSCGRREDETRFPYSFHMIAISFPYCFHIKSLLSFPYDCHISLLFCRHEE